MIFVVVVLMIVVAGVSAQENSHYNLGIEDAIALGLKNNSELSIAASDISIAKSEYSQTNSLFLPSVELSHKYIRTNDPLANFGFKLGQESVVAEDFNPMLLNDPGYITNHQTTMMVQQPLINVDGIMMRKAAKRNVEAQEYK